MGEAPAAAGPLPPPAPGGESDALHASKPSAAKHEKAAAVKAGAPMGRFFETSNIQTSERAKTVAYSRIRNGDERGRNAN